MIWLFPIAGRGTRTKKYGKFKPFIEVMGHRIIHWCLKGIRQLVAEGDKFIFITTEAFEHEFDVQKGIEEIFRQEKLGNPLEMVLAKNLPQGPAASVYLSKDLLQENEPCTVVNADQFIFYESKPNLALDEGYIPIYFNCTGDSSYVEIKEGRIVSIYEKEMKTYYASAGIYALGSAKLLIEAIEYAFAKKILYNNEYYIGPALNYVIENGGVLYPVQTFVKLDLGSIGGIERFIYMFEQGSDNNKILF